MGGGTSNHECVSKYTHEEGVGQRGKGRESLGKQLVFALIAFKLVTWREAEREMLQE